MSRFDNKTCPVCKTPLTDKSDVVVCPICGAPHHRACYMKYNRCGLESYHASGFVWKGYLPWEQPEEKPEEKPDDPHVGEYPQDTPQFINAETGEPVDLDINDFIERLKQQSMDDSRTVDGVSSHELTCFVGRSVMHYNQAFSVFRAPAKPGEKRRCVFFNFCAGLFRPVHQFYRRMDGIGVLLLLLQLTYYIPAALSVAGIANAPLLNNIQLFTSMLNFAAMIAMSFFGDYLYYRFCVRRIKKIRERFDGGKAPGYYEALSAKGTPSWLRAIAATLAVYLTELCVILYLMRLNNGALL